MKDVPVSDANYKYCKNVLGINLLDGLSLYDSSQAQINYMWELADKYDLYIWLWSLFEPSAREELINANKNQPHLFGWQLWDEVDGARTKQQQMVCHDEIRGYDPNHPTIMIWNLGETWNWEPNAFEILCWDCYPCFQREKPVIKCLHDYMTVFYHRDNLIKQAISMGKQFIPFLHAFPWTAVPGQGNPAPWCHGGTQGTGCRIIQGETGEFAKYNGMYGMKALYLEWKELAGGHTDGACFYNWQPFDAAHDHPCVHEIRKQIKDLNYELLGAEPPEPEEITCPQCQSLLKIHA